MATRKSSFSSEEEKEKKIEQARQEIEAETKRRMRGTGKVWHDLFKLELAYMKKNMGLPKKPRLEDVEHVHFFHTFDSFGKKQTHCNRVGGHTHEVKVKKDENGNLYAECGPAIRDFKKNSKEQVPFEDNHTHKVVYIDSQEVDLKTRNKLAVEDLNRLRQNAGISENIANKE